MTKPKPKTPDADKRNWPDDPKEDPASYPLPNPKQERFAQEVASGKALHDAYHAAGYRGTPANARRLRADEAVWERIEFLQTEIGAKVTEKAAQEIVALGYSREDAFREAGQALALALALGQAGPAGAAVKLRCEIAGVTLGDTGAPPADPEGKNAKNSADPKVVDDIAAVKNARKLIVVGGTDAAGAARPPAKKGALP